MLCYVAENMEKLVLGGGSYSQSGFYFSAQKTEDFEPLSTDPSGNALGICGKTAEKAADSVYVAQHTQVAAQVCAG